MMPDLPPWLPWLVAAGAGVGVALLLTRRSEASALPESVASPTATPSGTSQEATVSHATPPPAPSGPETGSQFMLRMSGVSERGREQSALEAILRGNVPSSGRTWKPIAVSGLGHTGTLFVRPDVVAVGTDADFVRVPLTPQSAQTIADATDAMLPTRKIADMVYQQADVKLPFHGLTPRSGETRNSNRLVVESNRLAEVDRHGRTGVMAGHKKDIVVGALQNRSPGKVVIYGGFYADGSRVQPLTNVHDDTYLDYSQVPRFVKDTMIVDGSEWRVEDVLRDPVLNALVSDEGVVNRARY